MRMKNNDGFTLMEVIISIVIILGIAGLVIPRVGLQLKKIRSSEASQILMIVHGEQQEYKKDNGAYAKDTQWNDLGIDKPTLQNFGAVVLNQGNTNLTCGAGGNVKYVASTAFNGGDFTLYALTSGAIACKPATGPCPGSPCSNMGFGDFTP